MASEGTRYTEAEVRQILEQAALVEARGTTPAPTASGYTLADIREIAKLAGIDPSGVDRAVLGGQEPEVSHRILGIPATFVLDATCTRQLSSGQMHAAVGAAERIFGDGAVQDGGNWLEWQDARRTAFLGVARGSEQTRIRILSDHSRPVLAIVIVAGILSATVWLQVMGAYPLPIGVASGVGVFGTAYAVVRGCCELVGVRIRHKVRRLLAEITDDIAATPS